MCGIFGVVDFKNEVYGDLEVLRESTNLLTHRGPDSYGEWYNQNVFLGHRRLSIIDLSEEANQPFHSKKNPVSIIFNGEIYNYKLLSLELDGLHTNSDTEVILEGFIRFGVSFFFKLRGIFAFSIFDQRGDGEIFFYRDLGGVKPLYYYQGDKKIVWASEIKSIRNYIKKLSLNEQILKSYLSLGYCLEPQTIYTEVNAVEPGQLMICNLKTEKIEKISINSYSLQQNHFSIERNTNEVRRLLSQAVDRNCVSDVPVSFSLSGGIDSSLIFAFGKTQNDKALTVKFADKDYDESAIAENYGAMLNKKVDIIDSSLVASLSLLKKILSQFDQPYADSSAIPFYLLSKTAASFTKVLIGGDGGDEIHNGYPGHQIIPSLFRWRGLAPPLQLLKYFVRKFSPVKYRKLDRLTSLMGISDMNAICCEWQSWLPSRTKFKGNSPLLFNPDVVFKEFEYLMFESPFQNIEEAVIGNFFYKRLLSDYLRKSDMMSMMNSLEYRVPMLDEDLVQYSLSIPYKQKSNRYSTKTILRSIHSDFFPKSTSYAPKKGFGIPLDTWLSNTDFVEIQECILDPKGIVCAYVDRNYILFLFDCLRSSNPSFVSRESVYQRIFLLYSLQLWHLRSL